MGGIHGGCKMIQEAQFRGAACKANKQDLGIMPLGWNQVRTRVREKVLGSFYPMELRAII